MNTIYKKKLAGTITYTLIVAAVILGIGWQASARLIQNTSSLIVDGVVVSTSSDSVTIATAGSSPIELQTDNRTILLGAEEPTDYLPGTVVSVVARSSGSQYLARIVQTRPGSGYGFLGDSVITRRGDIIAKGADNFTIDTGLLNVTYYVTSSTLFSRTSFAELSVGNTVQVIGKDTGSNFTATIVISR